MAQKSWHLNRRTFLQGVGVSLSLPFMEAMSWGQGATRELPRRMCAFYWPFGIVFPTANQNQPESWKWFPTATENGGFRLGDMHTPLERFRNETTYFHGLCHAKGKMLEGHETADVFLTGGDSRATPGNFRNAISVDQVAARHFGSQTRCPSLVLSADEGVGTIPLTHSLSYTQEGRAIPALASPRQVFNLLFGRQGASAEMERRRLQNTSSMLDLVMESSRSLRNRLGQHDQRKLDDYLDSVRGVEQEVHQAERWLDVPRPNVEETSVALDAGPREPQNYFRAIYDLIYLAFQTDTTRLATYMICTQNLPCPTNAIPNHLGMGNTWHDLGHGGSDAGNTEKKQKLVRVHQFLCEQLAYFMNRLRTTREGDGNLLDRTMILYGSTNDGTHNNSNYPLILAGGRGLGLKHNQYLNFRERGRRTAPPLSNLFLTMLHRLNVPAERFSDSTGEMTEILT